MIWCFITRGGFELNSVQRNLLNSLPLSLLYSIVIVVRERVSVSALLTGYYQTEQGNDTCVQCPAGYECTASTASVCNAGTFSELGQSDCLTCPSGKESPSHTTISLLQLVRVSHQLLRCSFL